MIDVDECELDVDECRWNEKCVNLFGSYECVCQNGFKSVNSECVGK